MAKPKLAHHATKGGSGDSTTLCPLAQGLSLVAVAQYTDAIEVEGRRASHRARIDA